MKHLSVRKKSSNSNRTRDFILVILFLFLIGSSGCTVRFRFGQPENNSMPTSPPHQLSFNLVAGVSDLGGASVDSTGTAARFNFPTGIASDGTNLYITDTNSYTIRKMVISSGAVSTLTGIQGEFNFYPTNGPAGTATFAEPTGIVYSGGYLYVTDELAGQIRKIDVTNGTTSTLSGIGNAIEQDSTDGTGATVFFDYPDAITTDGTSLYTVDLFGGIVRKINMTTGDTVTISGSTSFPPTIGFADGTGSSASFKDPGGIAIDSSLTNLYVADTGNCTIRQVVISSGLTTTVAGLHGACSVTDSTDGTGATARFINPTGLYADASSLYVSDGSVIRKMDLSTGNTTTIAGNSGVSGTTDSTDGTGATATFSVMNSVVKEGGNIYLPTTIPGGPIRQVSLTGGDTSTIAGLALSGTSDSTNGTGSTARFENPIAVTADADNAYVVDYLNAAFTIRKTNLTTGATTTLAGLEGNYGTGSGDSTDGTGATARFGQISGSISAEIVVVGNDLYFGDEGRSTIRKIDTVTGNTTTLAGTYSSTGFADSSDGTGATAKFYLPAGVASDGTFLYVSDSENFRIRKIALPTGNTTTLAGSSTNGHVDSTDGTGATARFTDPTLMTVQGDSVFVVDGYAIVKVNTSTGNTTTFAGNALTSGTTDGVGTLARFSAVRGLSSDDTNLYVSDGSIIRSVNLTTGAVSTYLGPNGVIDIAASAMPTVQALFSGAQGLFFTNFYSAIYLVH